MKTTKAKYERQPDLLNRKQYLKLRTKAREFAQALTGDAGFEWPGSNLIALESMLVGWLRSTKEWRKYDAWCAKHRPRTDIYIVAYDQALQAAQDAISGMLEPRFSSPVKTEAKMNLSMRPWN